MNSFFIPTIHVLAMNEGAGGLFDFNATLPLIAIQFVLLTVTLTFVFYKPVAKVLKERETFIQCNLTTASEKLLTAEDLFKQYEEQLKTARINAQAIITQSEKEAKDKVAIDIGQARIDATRLIEQTNKKLEAQESIAIEQLDMEVEELSYLIEEKLLGEKMLSDSPV